MAEPAWIYNTGAVDCYLGGADAIDTNGPSLTTGANPESFNVTPYYLGTCEQYPVVEETVNWSPVFCDIGGPMEPFDEQFQGKSKIIVLDLQRFNETNMKLYNMDSEGDEGINARGKLLLANGQWVRLWLAFRNYGTPNASSTPDMPPGEMYWATKLMGKYYDRMGTVARKTRLVIGARPVYYPQELRFRLYSNNPAHFAGLPDPG